MDSPFTRLVRLACRKAAPKDCPPLQKRVLAKRCGCSRQFFYFLERGWRSASPAKIRKIAEGMRVSQETVRRTIAASRVERP